MRSTPSLAATAVSLLLASLPTSIASGQCTPGPHSGTITADQTWCLADSPHVLAGDVTVAAGATLTIQAGVEVDVAFRASLTIQGRLVSQGTAASPITLTGGQWGLVFSAGTGSLTYTSVLGAGFNKPGIAASSVPSPGLVLDHCTVGPGPDGLAITDSNVTLTDTTITGIGETYGFGASPVGVQGASSVLSLSNNTFSGNTANQIYLAPGAMSGADFTLVPQTGLDGYGFDPYTIPAGRTVTLAAGVTMLPTWGSHMTIQGRLVAQGTAAQPVTFGTGGQWTGLVFSGGTGSLSYCNFVHAGWNTDGIAVSSVPAPGLVMDHCTLSGGAGLTVTDSSVTLTNDTFTGIGSSSLGNAPVGVAGPSSVLTLANNTFSGNTYNQIYLAPGAMSGADFTLVPQTGLDGYGFDPYTIPAGRTVTLAAGVTMLPTWGSHMTIQGRLVAQGTAAQRVTFTSGRWTGLNFDGGTGDLAHCVFVNAGFNSNAITASNVTSGEVRFQDCLFTGGAAIYGTNSRITLINTALVNGGDAWRLQMQNASNLTATHTTLSGNPNMASIESGSTATFTNTIVAGSPTGWGVVNDGTATVTMTHTLWDNVARPTSGTVTQNGFLTGPAAFAADGYHLTANSYALGQGVATTVTDDIDGEVRPQPARTFPDLGADEAPWAAPLNRTATPINLGQTVSGTANNGTFVDYVLNLAEGQATNLVVKLTPAGAAGSWSLYGRLGAFPYTTLNDVQSVVELNGTVELLIPAPKPGAWYFSVLYSNQAGGSAPFQLQVQAVDRFVGWITPSSGGNTGSVTAEIAGFGFASGMSIQLRTAGVTLRSFAPAAWDETALSVQLDLTGLAPQAYDVCVVWPDAFEGCLPRAFTVQSGGSSNLVANLVIPGLARVGRPTTLFLEYRNAGTENMPAPLFMVRSTQNVPMRLGPPYAFRRQPVQILAIDQKGIGTAGTLPPGEAQRLSFQIIPEGSGHSKLDFEILIAEPGSANPLNWTALEADFQSAEIDTEAWSRLWALFRSEVGTTVGDWATALRRSADGLSAYGRYVDDPALLWVSRLNRLVGWGVPTNLTVGLDASAPAPGPPLALVRTYPNSLLSRLRLGPFGRGWTNALWDTVLTASTAGDIVIRGASNELRRFAPQPDGTFQGAPDDHGRLASTGGIFTLTETNLTVSTFRSDGHIGSIADRFGNRVDLTYDASGYLTRVSHSSGDHIDLAWDGHGRIVQLTDHAGQATIYAYDASGDHLTSVTAPGNRVWSYTYAPATGGPADHALTSITLPDGTHRYFDYDAQGRCSRRRADGGAEPVSYGYNEAGVLTTTDGAGNTSYAAFDESGRIVATADPSGIWGRLTYDDSGNVVRAADPLGRDAQLSYGPFGDLTHVVDVLGGDAFLRREYTEEGGVFTLGLVDPVGNASTFDLGTRHEPLALNYPDGSQWQFTVDGSGQTTAAKNRRGQAIGYTRNARGQVLRKDLPDGTFLTYQYDTTGRIVSAAGPDGTIALTYDTRGFLVRVTEPDGSFVSWEYNDSGKRTRRTTSDGAVVNWIWDAAGRLSEVRDGSGGLFVKYTYDSAGRLWREDRGNGTSTTTTYDGSGRPVLIDHRGADNSVQESLAYEYDVRGNPIRLTNGAGVTTWTWDALGQLIGVHEPSGRVISFAYDAAGNRIQTVDSGATTTYTLNALNQITQANTATYAYDADGNLLSRTDATGTTTYEWDADGRLARVNHPTAGIFTYNYDALGRLAAEVHGSTTTRFTHDGSFIESERDGTGTLLARYVAGYGLAARLPGTGGPLYYGFDVTGSTRLMTDATGNIVNRYDWGPFGEPRTTVEGVPNSFRYAARWGVRTEGHGLLRMGARPYDPALGRFVAPDPIGYFSGFNVYTYCGSAPIQRVDPSGLENIGGDIKNTIYSAVGTIEQKAIGTISGILTAPDSMKDSLEEIVEGCKSGDANAIVHGTGEFAWTLGSSVGSATVAAVESGTALVSGTEGATVVVGGVALAPALAVGGLVILADDIGTDLYLESVKQQRAFLEHGPAHRNAYVVWAKYRRPDGSLPPELLKLWRRLHGSPEVITPGDPNGKLATPGAGPRHIVKAGTPLTFTVFFQNVPTASAPAQEVVVSDPLDGNLDWSTLRLTEVAWGGTCIPVSGDGSSFATRVAVPDYRSGDARTWWVDVAAEQAGGQQQWTFRTLDPATNDLPADALAGFLPPDDSTGRGEGQVSFTVNSMAGLPTGTHIVNTASIVFDQNAAIATNQTDNVIGIAGDGNDDGSVNPADVFYLVNCFFDGGPAPLGLADCNGDGEVSISDIFYLINYLYAAGPAPVD